MVVRMDRQIKPDGEGEQLYKPYVTGSDGPGSSWALPLAAK